MGWSVGTLVVAIAAGLLVTLIVLARRIVRQAEDITEAIDNARENTTALFAVTETNATIERITGQLRTVREGLAPE